MIKSVNSEGEGRFTVIFHFDVKEFPRGDVARYFQQKWNHKLYDEVPDSPYPVYVVTSGNHGKNKSIDFFVGLSPIAITLLQIYHSDWLAEMEADFSGLINRDVKSLMESAISDYEVSALIYGEDITIPTNWKRSK